MTVLFLTGHVRRGVLDLYGRVQKFVLGTPFMNTNCEEEPVRLWGLDLVQLGQDEPASG